MEAIEMRLKRMVIILAAAASLMATTTPAYAFSATPSPPQLRTLTTPDGLLRSRNVDPKTANGCGEFKGTLSYYAYLIGGNYEFEFDVVGTLYDHCGSTGVAKLYADYVCSGISLGPTIGRTFSSESIDWGSSECSSGIANMHVQVCWTNNSNTFHQCADSPNL